MEGIVGVFRSRAAADNAVDGLQAVGASPERIAYITPETGDTELARTPTTNAEEAGIGKAITGYVGGLVGASGGLALGTVIAGVLVPGVGPIVGNGSFPLLVLDAARARGLEVVVAAIKEEAFPEIEARGAAAVHWLSLGELSRLIDTFKREGIRCAVMAGQVKHKQIFSAIRPDWRLAKLLMSLRTRNTDALIGAVAKVLGDEGIALINSTTLLEPLLARPGVLTRRSPGDEEQRDIEYGRAAARHLAQYDIGQTVVVAGSACVAVEAMEGTDATIERAGQIMAAVEGASSTLSRRLTVVKVAKPNQDMRFDVPVVGVKTIEVMHNAGAACLAVDAGRCLLIDGDAVIEVADGHGMAIVAG